MFKLRAFFADLEIRDEETVRQAIAREMAEDYGPNGLRALQEGALEFAKLAEKIMMEVES